jgi:hypothetical protein
MASFISVMFGQTSASSAFSSRNTCWSSGQLVLGEDRVDRALGLAQGAVDALVRVDHEEVRALVEAVHGTHFHAVRVLAHDAVFADDKGHTTVCPEAVHRGAGSVAAPSAK